MVQTFYSKQFVVLQRRIFSCDCFLLGFLQKVSAISSNCAVEDSVPEAESDREEMKDCEKNQNALSLR